MKKTVSVLFCILLILSSFTVCFAAAGVSCSASASSVKAGEKVTVTVSVSGASSSKAFGVTLSYDSKAFDLVSNECLVKNTSIANFNVSKGQGACSYPETVITGSVWKFTFQAKKDASIGSYSFKISVKFEGSSAVTGSASVKIACTHNYGAWTKVSDATCTKAGSEKRTCSICGNTETRAISATGHKYGKWTEKTAPTCTKAGTKVRTCSVCGAEEKASVKALGHELQESTVTLEATCTSHGQATGLCTRCGQIATVETPFAEHSYGAWTETKAATCTEAGTRVHSCDVCGHEESEASLPLGHDFQATEEIQQATIYSEGISEALCSRCGEAQRVTTPCIQTLEDTGLFFQAETGIFLTGTQIFAELLQPAEGEEEIYTRYTVSFETEEGEACTPGGSFDITFPIPEGYGRNISVNYSAEEGVSKEIPCIINLLDHTVKISADGAGTYEITNIDKVPPVYEGLSPQQKNYAIMGGLGFTTLLFLVLYLTKKPKVKAEELSCSEEKPEENKEQIEESIPAENTDLSEETTPTESLDQIEEMPEAENHEVKEEND